jgi:cytochrome c553
LKRWIVSAATVLAVIAGFALLGVVSGLVPIKASSGHWTITEWFLHFAMRRSVVTQTLGLEAPALDHPNLVLKGAGHYETGCRPCHGSPDLRRPKIARGMTPHPPDLPSRIPEWRPRHLFYIVKHGIKFTGMPAWPAQQRDDEVWAMVAFLRELPRLDAGAYRRLAHGEAAPSGTRAPLPDLLQSEERLRAMIDTSCARCHGMDGRGRGAGAFPALAGQRSAYLLAALRAYARGERHSGIMQPIAAALTIEEMRGLGRYYGTLSPPVSRPSDPAASSAIERGKAIAHRGIPPQRVPSCADCHGPGAIRRNPRYPVLAGQHADYLVLQLELFKKRQRGGSAYSHLMLPVASRLAPEQMRDVALYYESLAAAASTH